MLTVVENKSNNEDGYSEQWTGTSLSISYTKWARDMYLTKPYLPEWDELD